MAPLLLLKNGEREREMKEGEGGEGWWRVVGVLLQKISAKQYGSTGVNGPSAPLLKEATQMQPQHSVTFAQTALAIIEVNGPSAPPQPARHHVYIIIIIVRSIGRTQRATTLAREKIVAAYRAVDRQPTRRCGSRWIGRQSLDLADVDGI